MAAKRAKVRFLPGQVQQSLLDFLGQQIDAGQDGLLFPVCNYDYGRTREFNVDSAHVQVGALPEWIRTDLSFRRSAIPFFSFLSMYDLGLPIEGTINPFGMNSGFQWLVDHDATLMLFGMPLSRLTFIHYVEELIGKPLFRYDKNSPGQIIERGATRKCDFVMHERPMGVHLDYDWPRLEKDFLAVGVMNLADYSVDVKWLRARELLEFWKDQIVENSFYLIDAEFREHFEVATVQGLQRITLEDYENV